MIKEDGDAGLTEEVKALLASQEKSVANRLRLEREKQRISQIDLSFMAGLSQNQVFYIETSKRIPNLHTLLKICNALKINPASLFETCDADREKARETIIELAIKYI
ncbi:MAG: helix-turn-helix domain-containing protein [Spirochaetaceae bacterium]|jgi:transcriptional regulator with XRE-family HTH domain|nr:helix-turn-helix domain-containing protein [Spirochaetaceae bacterium]